MIRTAAFAAFAALAASAQDWPGWRGAGRDGKVSGFAAPATWPKELSKNWSVEVGIGHATPALVDGRLYIHARQGEDEVVLCLQADSGKEVWRDRIAAPYTMDPTAEGHGKGPKSSPAVAGGRVFAFGISGILTCLDAATGKILWRHETAKSPQYGTAMSPLVTEGLCVVHIGGPGKGSIVAYEAESGKSRWSWDGDGPGYASPILASIGGRPQIVTQTQFFAVGLSPADGKLLWKLDYKTNFDQNSVTPIAFENTVVLSGFKNGAAAWRIDGPQPVQVWSTAEVSMYMSTAVLKGDRLFGFSEKKRGQFFCLDARTGKTLWTGDGRQGENAALLDAGEVLFALTTDRALIALDPSEKAYAERARWIVAESPTWAHPVVSGSSIYIKDETRLTRWTIP